MSVDLSKIGYGVLVGSGDQGINLSKAGYGVLVGSGASGVNLSKIGFGIIIDTLTPEPSAGRRRQNPVIS